MPGATPLIEQVPLSVIKEIEIELLPSGHQQQPWRARDDSRHLVVIISGGQQTDHQILIGQISDLGRQASVISLMSSLSLNDITLK